MNEPKMCCNCLHCARWKRKNGIECHCDLTDKYLGYLDVFDEDRNCKHWEKETKWDLQKKHDSELLDKVMQKQRTIIDDDGVMYRVVFLKDIEDIKSEVQKGAENDRS